MEFGPVPDYSPCVHGPARIHEAGHPHPVVVVGLFIFFITLNMLKNMEQKAI